MLFRREADKVAESLEKHKKTIADQITSTTEEQTKQKMKPLLEDMKNLQTKVTSLIQGQDVSLDRLRQAKDILSKVENLNQEFDRTKSSQMTDIAGIQKQQERVNKILDDVQKQADSHKMEFDHKIAETKSTMESVKETANQLISASNAAITASSETKSAVEKKFLVQQAETMEKFSNLRQNYEDLVSKSTITSAAQQTELTQLQQQLKGIQTEVMGKVGGAMEAIAKRQEQYEKENKTHQELQLEAAIAKAKVQEEQRKKEEEEEKRKGKAGRQHKKAAEKKKLKQRMKKLEEELELLKMKQQPKVAPVTSTGGDGKEPPKPPPNNGNNNNEPMADEFAEKRKVQEKRKLSAEPEQKKHKKSYFDTIMISGKSLMESLRLLPPNEGTEQEEEETKKAPPPISNDNNNDNNIPAGSNNLNPTQQKGSLFIDAPDITPRGEKQMPLSMMGEGKQAEIEFYTSRDVARRMGVSPQQVDEMRRNQQKAIGQTGDVDQLTHNVGQAMNSVFRWLFPGSSTNAPTNSPTTSSETGKQQLDYTVAGEEAHPRPSYLNAKDTNIVSRYHARMHAHQEQIEKLVPEFQNLFDVQHQSFDLTTLPNIIDKLRSDPNSQIKTPKDLLGEITKLQNTVLSMVGHNETQMAVFQKLKELAQGYGIGLFRKDGSFNTQFASNIPGLAPYLKQSETIQKEIGKYLQNWTTTSGTGSSPIEAQKVNQELVNTASRFVGIQAVQDMIKKSEIKPAEMDSITTKNAAIEGWKVYQAGIKSGKTKEEAWEAGLKAVADYEPAATTTDTRQWVLIYHVGQQPQNEKDTIHDENTAKELHDESEKNVYKHIQQSTAKRRKNESHTQVV